MESLRDFPPWNILVLLVFMSRLVILHRSTHRPTSIQVEPSDPISHPRPGCVRCSILGLGIDNIEPVDLLIDEKKKQDRNRKQGNWCNYTASGQLVGFPTGTG